MKIIPIEQQTSEWLKWRKTVITGTDCAAIMESSPWQTPYKCWQKKLGLIEENKSNEAMERGKKLEPVARAQFIESYGINMIPVVVESSEYDFLGASLDGLSECHKYVIEIKCGGIKLHTMASNGIIPAYYLHQIQHQLLVTGAEKCFYYSFDGTNGICIEVYADPKFIEEYMPKARDFWRKVAFFESPSLKDSDFNNMNDNLDWNKYANMYQETDIAIKTLEDKKDYIRKKLIELCADHSCVGNGVKVMKNIIKGRIAYDEIPEIQGIDLEKHRKGSTTCWKIFRE